jgi:hypothetical protein
VIVLARHGRIRTEFTLFCRCAARTFASSCSLLIAIISVGAIFGLVLLRREYGTLWVGSAASVGDFSNFHRAWVTLYSLLCTADNYHFIYLFRAYPEIGVSRVVATVFITGYTALVFVVAAVIYHCAAAALSKPHRRTVWVVLTRRGARQNSVCLFYQTYSAALETRSKVCRARARHWLSLSFKRLDDRDQGPPARHSSATDAW